MHHHGIKLVAVLAYARMSNGRAEKMLGKLKRAIKKTLIAYQRDWAAALSDVL